MIWDEIKNALKNEINEGEFEDYISEMEYDVTSSRSDLAVFSVPNIFIKSWIASSYKNLIVDAFEKKTNIKPELVLNVKSEVEPKKHVKSLSANTAQSAQNAGFHQLNATQNTEPNPIPNVNTYMTFERFIVGESNKYAHTVAKTIAEHQAAYNPVLIYGKTGLGKTHLLHAIGNYAMEEGKKVIFTTGEQFLNDFVHRIQTKTMDRFRDRFRGCDYLLIDDIQFFAGKEQIQEEFFHTFNELYEKKSQIVMASDKLPKTMNGLEERLKSRFERGTMARIEAPGVEMKASIIRLKCQLNNILLDDETIDFIAANAGENVRQIEGILTNINVRMQLLSARGVEIAKVVLEDYQRQRQEDVTIKNIIEAVSAALNIKISEIKSKSKIKRVSDARKFVIFLAKELTSISLAAVAIELGMKDHSSVSKALKSMMKDVDEKESVRALVDEIKNRLIG